MTAESRSADDDSRTLPLWPDLVPPLAPPQTRGVGGRRGRRAPPKCVTGTG